MNLPENLNGFDFTDLILNNLDLSHKDLRECIFHRTKLRNVKFARAHIQGADFSYADLRGADFRRAINNYDSSKPVVNFTRSKIGGANFEGVNLSHADFTGATLGLNPYWIWVLGFLHLILFSTSAFTSTISITFLWFFLKKKEEISFFASTIIYFISVGWIIILRILLLNNNHGLAIISVNIGIVVISIILAITFVNETIQDKRFYSGSTTVLLLLFVVLVILFNPILFADIENILSQNPGFKNIIYNFGKGVDSSKYTNGLALSVIIATAIGGIFGCLISKLAIDKRIEFNWLWKIYIAVVTKVGTLFKNAILDDAIFNFANLKGANFKGAKINRTIWRSAKFLDHARIINSYLEILKIRSLILDREIELTNEKGFNDFSNLDLKGINLQGINLREAKFVGTNLKGATFKDCDLTNVDLREANLNDTNLEGATLNSAYIHDIITNNRTEFTNIQCSRLLEKSKNRDGDSDIVFPPLEIENFNFEKYLKKDPSIIKLFIAIDNNEENLRTAFVNLTQGRKYDLRGFRFVDNIIIVEMIAIDSVDIEEAGMRFQIDLNSENEGSNITNSDEVKNVHKTLGIIISIISHTHNITMGDGGTINNVNGNQTNNT
jgi:uncharacterized protein YjbI with pentapeptide repeats